MDSSKKLTYNISFHESFNLLNVAFFYIHVGKRFDTLLDKLFFNSITMMKTTVDQITVALCIILMLPLVTVTVYKWNKN